MSPRRRKADQTPSQRLAHAISRLGRVIRADPGHNPEAPEPGNDWERAIEERLAGVEQKLANQNRLLLLSIIAIAADAIFKLTR